MVRMLGAVIPLIMLIACAGGGAGAPSDLDSARVRWVAGGIVDYSIDFERHCFCVPAAIEPVTIEVRAGVVSEVRSRATGDSVEPTENVPWYSVEDLFLLIEAAEREAGALSVEYAREGYPRMIRLGDLAADAGVEYRTSSLRPVP